MALLCPLIASIECRMSSAPRRRINCCWLSKRANISPYCCNSLRNASINFCKVAFFTRQTPEAMLRRNPLASKALNTVGRQAATQDIASVAPPCNVTLIGAFPSSAYATALKYRKGKLLRRRTEFWQMLPQHLVPRNAAFALQLCPEGLSEIGIEFLKIRFDSQNSLGMNLANARLGQPEYFGNLTQPHILEIIKGKHLALHFRELLQPLCNQRRNLAAEGAIHRIFLPLVGQHLVLRNGILLLAVEGGIKTD